MPYGLVQSAVGCGVQGHASSRLALSTVPFQRLIYDHHHVGLTVRQEREDAFHSQKFLGTGGDVSAEMRLLPLLEVGFLPNSFVYINRLKTLQADGIPTPIGVMSVPKDGCASQNKRRSKFMRDRAAQYLIL